MTSRSRQAAYSVEGDGFKLVLLWGGGSEHGGQSVFCTDLIRSKSERDIINIPLRLIFNRTNKWSYECVNNPYYLIIIKKLFFLRKI